MMELTLNAKGWQTKDDVYDAFFHAVGAPTWHGRNFDALNDSIGTGQINALEVPYRIVIINEPAFEEARKMIRDFADLIHELASRGCPVEIMVDGWN
jgi:RNAse (barnase) inhibitor barstar